MLRINKKLNLALEILVILASSDFSISSRDLAKKLGVGIKSIEQILLLLRRENIVLASRGSLGGYRLFKEPNELMILEIMQAVEGKQWAYVPSENDVNFLFWKDLKFQLENFLKQSLVDFCKYQKREKAVLSYSI